MELQKDNIRLLIPPWLHEDTERYERLLEKIRNGLIFGSLDSPYSQKLHAILKELPELTTENFKRSLDAAEIYGVNINVCNACAAIKTDQPQIIITEGLLHLINFYAEYIAVMPAFQATRGNNILEVDGVKEAEPEIFSLAVNAAALHFLETGSGIIPLHDIMSEKLLFSSRVAFLGASIFLIGHELGHLELGHLTSNDTRLEAKTFAMEEIINRSKEEEIAADTYAYNCFSEDYRADNISSILILFTVFSLLETMILPSTSTHPLTLNRMINLANLAALSDDVEQTTILRNIIAAEVQRYLRLQEFRARYRHKRGSELLAQSMPLDKAFHIIETIKSRIISEQGKL